MKRVVLLCLMLVILTSCKNHVKETADLKIQKTKDNLKEAIRVVEEYNKAVFSKNWDKAEGYLDGQAKKAFILNRTRYKNSGNLLLQENVFETKGEKFCVIKSKIDFEILIAEKKDRILARKWMRYFLIRTEEWKIIRAETLSCQYPSYVTLRQETEDDEVLYSIVKDFIKYSAEGNVKKASKYLTANLLNNAEKFKIEHVPTLKLDEIKVNVIGDAGNEKFIEADYIINGKKLKGIFYLIKLKDKWLIDNIINW